MVILPKAKDKIDLTHRSFSENTLGYFMFNCTAAQRLPNDNLMDTISDLKTEGLFRKTGNVARQRLLKEWLNEGVDLCLDQSSFTPHDCATVLKNYLSELPEPLLTERHYQAHLQVVGTLVDLCKYCIQDYFCPFSLANSFAQSWILPDKVMFKKR